MAAGRSHPAPQSYPLTWEQPYHLEGAVDVAGPRRDGSLVVMATGRLSLISPAGAITPYASSPNGYAGPADAEPYMFLIPDVPPQPAGCAFTRDDLFILDLTTPPGLARVDTSGISTRFADLPEVDWLYGIALDTVGRFDYRLLVAGTHADHTLILAVDCLGGHGIVTDNAPFVEGGFEVAPPPFGPYAGDLIAPDELSGQLFAVAPDGTVRVVDVPALPTGGDIGVESLGFVPLGFISAATSTGAAYLADRGTPGNPFPGTDSVLRLSAQALASAGVRDGDLLVSTEGGGLTVAVRCDPGAAACASFPVAHGPAASTVGHIEGRIAFLP